MKYLLFLILIYSCSYSPSIQQQREHYLECSDEISCISVGHQYCQEKKMGLDKIIKDGEKFKVKCRERLIQRK